MNLYKYNYFISTILLLLLSSSVYSEVSVVDDKNNIVRLNQPAQRIISLAPHITESLFAAGAGNKVVGVVAYSDYPAAAKKITRIGGYPTADLEKIISLKPDLVIVWPSGNNLKQIETLNTFGIKVYMSEPHYPQDIAKTIQRFGVLAGTSQVAEKAANEFTRHYNALKQSYSHKPKVKVFYQIWNNPLMTINGKHLISNIIELCGGINVFADLKTITPKISIEAVIASQADVIAAGGMEQKTLEWSAEWKRWPQIPAVKQGHIYFIDPDILQRVGPRILLGADELCQKLDQVRNQ